MHNFRVAYATLLIALVFALVVSTSSFDGDQSTASDSDYDDQGLSDGQMNCTNDSTIVDQLLRNHNKRKVPDDGNVDVTVEIWVQDVSRIVEISSEFELDLYVTEQWLDGSLAYEDQNPCKRNLSLNADKILKQIWTPNSCFVNSKNASVHKSPYHNFFLMIYSNGTVWVNYRIKVTGPCEKDLKTFPIDRQHCFLTYESFSHNVDDVRMRWTAKPVSLLKEIKLPDYRLTNYSTKAVKRETLQKHDKRKKPGERYDPVMVMIEMWVQDVSRIVEISSEFELDLYVTELWHDPSLAYGQRSRKGCKPALSLNAQQVLHRLWTPNSCFINSKDASLHRSPFANTFLMIYANGTVWLNYRIRLTGPCLKDLRTFPIDMQRCFLAFESLHHNIETVQLRWIELEPLKILKRIRLPDYELIDWDTHRVLRVRPANPLTFGEVVSPVGQSMSRGQRSPVLNTTCADDDVIVPYMLSKHNRRRVPGDPAVVTLEVWVQDISRIIEVTSEFELDIYVTERWKDETLSFRDMTPCKHNLSLKAELVMPKIWTPNACFYDSKNASIHASPHRNVFLQIYEHGEVWVNYRIKLIGPCQRDIRKFPIDNQACKLTYESVQYNNERVQLFWHNPDVTFLKPVKLPDYSINITGGVTTNKKYRVGSVQAMVGLLGF